MDKLKYIKLENEDGSYSNSIPLAVDSDYVDVNGNTLTNELSAKANVSTLNENISNLQSQISGLASGSPAGVYETVTALTTADPDHSKIYIVSADGHWYYYNEGWQDGGEYQAAEDSTSVNNIKEDWKWNNLVNLYNYNEHHVDGYYVDNRGFIATSSNVSMLKFPVSAGETYYILNVNWILYRGKTIPSFAVAFLDSNDNVLYFENATNISNSSNKPIYLDAVDDFIKVTIPAGVTQIACNLKIVAFNIEHSMVITKDNPSVYSDFDTDIYLRDLINVSDYPNLYTYTNCIYNYIIDNTSSAPKTSTGSAYAKIPVKPLTKYYFYRPGEITGLPGDAIWFLDENLELLQNVDEREIKFQFINGGKTKVYFIKTPINCAYVYVNLKTQFYETTRTMVFREMNFNTNLSARDSKAREFLDFIENNKSIIKYPDFKTATVIYNEFENIDLIGANWNLNQYYVCTAQKGAIKDYAQTDYCILDVLPGETYFIKGKSDQQPRVFTLIKGEQNYTTNWDYPTANDDAAATEYLVTIPEGIYKMAINRWHDSSSGYYKQSQLEVYKINNFLSYPQNIYSNFNKPCSLIIKMYPQEEHPQYDRYLSAVYFNASRHAAIVSNLEAETGDVLEFQYSLATSHPELFDGWITNWSRTQNDVSRFTYLYTEKIPNKKFSALAGLLYNGDVKNQFIYNGWSNGGYIGFLYKQGATFNQVKDIPAYIMDLKIVNKTKGISYTVQQEDMLNNPRNTTYAGTKITPAGIDGYETAAQILEIPPIVEHHDALGFSKWYAIGDSITEKNFRAKTNYFDYCVNDLNIDAVNLGVSGTGYMRTNNTFITRIDQITTYNYDTDIITVYGSINDNSFVAEHLGQLGDTTTETLYGSMYTFFNTLFTKFGAVRVGLITPIPWKGSKTNTSAAAYKQALIDTANLFNVPYLDLEKCTNLRPDDSDFLNTYYMSDNEETPRLDTGGVHPNSIGHKLFYNRIKEFLKTL